MVGHDLACLGDVSLMSFLNDRLWNLSEQFKSKHFLSKKKYFIINTF
jgi:hypothetical protein